jgi:hypothetical protein
LAKRVLDFSRKSEAASRRKREENLLIGDTLKIWLSKMGRMAIDWNRLIAEVLWDLTLI